MSSLADPKINWTELMLLVAAGFGLTVLFTRPLIGWLARHQFGKAIRVDGPDHATKAGTPTMGGLGMLAAIGVVGAVLLAEIVPKQAFYTKLLDRESWEPIRIWLPLLSMASFAVLGLLDDLAGLARKGRMRELGVGLTARRMIALQTLIAVIVVWVVGRGMFAFGPIQMALSVVALVGTVNAVNMSDGLDGLAAGLCFWAFCGLGVCAHLLNAICHGRPLDRYLSCLLAHGPNPDVALAFVIAGACLGFLVFNRYPAQVFMGNVASMALGGALATLAIMNYGLWLLPILGAVFLAEVVSDILQVGYFKLTGGRRIFRMAPIHHHFELAGMPETEITARFRLAGLAAGLAAIALVVMLSTPIP